MRYVESVPRLGEMLVDQGIISETQLQEALAIQSRRGGKLAEILIERQHVDTGAIERAVATQPGVASVDLTRHRLSRELCRFVPEEFASKHLVFPIDQLGHTLTVGMAFPLDTATINALHEMTGLQVKVFYCKPAAIRDAIKKHYRPHGEVDWSEILATHDQRRRAKPNSTE